MLVGIVTKFASPRMQQSLIVSAGLLLTDSAAKTSVADLDDFVMWIKLVSGKINSSSSLVFTIVIEQSVNVADEMLSKSKSENEPRSASVTCFKTSDISNRKCRPLKLSLPPRNFRFADFSVASGFTKMITGVSLAAVTKTEPLTFNES